MANLKETYVKEIVPALQKKLGVANPMLVPRLTKIVAPVACWSLVFAVRKAPMQQSTAHVQQLLVDVLPQATCFVRKCLGLIQKAPTHTAG